MTPQNGVINVETGYGMLSFPVREIREWTVEPYQGDTKRLTITAKNRTTVVVYFDEEEEEE